MILYLNEDIDKGVDESQVIDALNRRVGVVINYATHQGARYIEPYVLGVTKAGNKALRAFQYMGSSKRGTPQWKLLRLDRIISWQPMERHFDVEPKARGYVTQSLNLGDKLLPQIIHTVQLKSQDQYTDLDVLRNKTRELQNNKPLNIKDLTVPQSQNKESVLSGPIDDIENQNIDNEPEVKQSPYLDTKSKEFQDMIKRNLEITQKEKARRGFILNNDKTIKYNDNTLYNDETEQEEEQDIKPAQNFSGPIEGDATDPKQYAANDLMSNEKFREMLTRNLALSNTKK